jgi:hypothetical protein
MTTLKQARAIAKKHVAKRWLPEYGTLYVDKQAYEDEAAYFLIVGARELLVDEDNDYLMLDDRAITVEKITGEVVELDALGDAARLDAMTPTKK